MQFQALPGPVLDLMRRGMVAQYATLNVEGMPIDTPILYFPSEDLSSFDLATGLSYPAKAERARRNPRVGLLLEGGPDEPVVSIAGMAAVRDADLQANANRYLAETCYTLPHNPDWSLARRAVWYWTRIIVEIAPVKVRWWNNPGAMDGQPHIWQAPADTRYPGSDPAPPGKTSPPAKWEERPWAALATQALARHVAGHLSLVDAQGFPLPIRALSITATDTGFALDLPRGIPGPLAGKCCLTFGGIETFLGQITGSNGSAEMRVERTLPLFPMTRDMTQLWAPAPDTRDQLMRRLIAETERRGQPIPSIPPDRPLPSEGYKRRMERMKAARP